MWKLFLAQMKEAVPAAKPVMDSATEAAGEAGAAAAPQGGLLSFPMMLVVFIAIMYFMMIRPQMKREKERRNMLGALSKGDTVVTTGGICGKIVNLSESKVIIEVDKNVTMEFVRSAIAQVNPRDGE